jgi:hypothetical protein
MLHKGLRGRVRHVDIGFRRRLAGRTNTGVARVPGRAVQLVRQLAAARRHLDERAAAVRAASSVAA